MAGVSVFATTVSRENAAESEYQTMSLATILRRIIHLRACRTKTAREITTTQEAAGLINAHMAMPTGIQRPAGTYVCKAREEGKNANSRNSELRALFTPARRSTFQR